MESTEEAVLVVSPTCHHYVTKLGNESKFYEILPMLCFSNEISHLCGCSNLKRGAEIRAGKLDGVAGLEPANVRIKI